MKKHIHNKNNQKFRACCEVEKGIGLAGGVLVDVSPVRIGRWGDKRIEGSPKLGAVQAQNSHCVALRLQHRSSALLRSVLGDLAPEDTRLAWTGICVQSYVL